MAPRETISGYRRSKCRLRLNMASPRARRQNGAGKSTLIKILSGAYRPDAGEMYLDGEAVSFASPLESQEAGIRTVYQETSLSPYLTVAQNLFLGHEPLRAGLPLIDHGLLYRQATEVLKQLGIEVAANTVLNRLPLAVQMMIEIGKALFAMPDHRSGRAFGGDDIARAAHAFRVIREQA